MATNPPKYYRFQCGTFIEANSFEEAKTTLMARIVDEQEVPENWTRCTCLGISHRYNCPEMDGVVTY